MSKAEALVLIHSLSAIIEDLRDLKWSDSTPQHVVAATDAHIKHLTEAAAEIRRLHGVGI